MTINKKLKLSFFIIFILLFLTFLLSMFSLNKSIKRLQNVIQINQLLQYRLLQFNKELNEEISSVKDILVFGNNEFLYQRKYSFFNKLKNSVDVKLVEINKLFIDTKCTDKELIAKFQNLSSGKKEIDDILEKTISIYRAKGKTAAKDYFYSQNLLRKYRELSLTANKNKNYYEKVFNAAIEKKQNIILIISVVFVIVIIIAIFITNMIAKKFTENIKYLILSAEQVSLGQLDSPIESKSGDELEDISRVFEYLRIEIKRNIEKIQKYKK